MIERIREARARDYQLVIEGYCEAADCPARESRIAIKDHDETLLPLLERRGLSCPVCGGRLKLHCVAARDDAQLRDDADARVSVALQMYRRDFPDALAVSMAVLSDDRLPPTPAGWWMGVR